MAYHHPKAWWREEKSMVGLWKLRAAKGWSLQRFLKNAKKAGYGFGPFAHPKLAVDGLGVPFYGVERK